MSPYEKIAAWIVPLAGDIMDLEDLPIHLEGSDISVVKHDEDHFLRLSVNFARSDYNPVLGLAKKQIEIINGVSSVRFPCITPVRFLG